MFTAAGEVVQPSEILYKRPILIERGSFRPATRLAVDLLERAREKFLEEPAVRGQDPVVLAEMTLRSLIPRPDVSHADFLARADILGALGLDVLISRFEPYYQLADYLARYTDQMIGLAVGLPSVRQIADEKYFTGLPGGVLESAGVCSGARSKCAALREWACNPTSGRPLAIPRRAEALPGVHSRLGPWRSPPLLSTVLLPFDVPDTRADVSKCGSRKIPQEAPPTLSVRSCASLTEWN